LNDKNRSQDALETKLKVIEKDTVLLPAKQTLKFEGIVEPLRR